MAEPTAGRQLGVLAILALAGAGLAAVAAALTWWSADYVDPLSGPLTITASGSTCVPEMVPLALVGLAGFGAALATRGVIRRVVGVAIGLCGGTVALRSALQFSVPPTGLVAQLTRPADPIGTAQLHPLGPCIAVLAGLLLTAAGVLVALGLGARRRLGSRYDAPTRAGGGAGGPVADPEGDPVDWWKALDAGADPTAPQTVAQTGPIGLPATGSSPHVSDDTSEGGYHNPNASGET